MMWQETAGVRRDTPARYMFPIFTAVDLDDMMGETTGRYRWEICRKTVSYTHLLGLHTCYNGVNKGKRACEGEQISKITSQTRSVSTVSAGGECMGTGEFKLRCLSLGPVYLQRRGFSGIHVRSGG